MRRLDKHNLGDPALAWAVIDALDSGTLVSGEGGRVIAYNQRLLELFGVTPDDFEESESASFEQVLAAKAVDERRVRTWMAETVECPNGDAHLLRLRNGRVLECRSVSLTDVPGKPRSWSFRDVTEEERALGELEDQAANQLADYERTPAMLHTSDAELRLLAVSDRFLKVLGYERRKVLGRKWIDLLNYRSRALVAWVVLPRLDEFGECADVPLQFLTAKGEAIRVLLTAVAEHDDDGELRRVMALMSPQSVQPPVRGRIGRKAVGSLD